MAPSHAYADDVSYTVTLTVTEQRGESGAPATATAAISNPAPAATARATPRSVAEGDAVQLSLARVTDRSQDGGRAQSAPVAVKF